MPKTWALQIVSGPFGSPALTVTMNSWDLGSCGGCGARRRGGKIGMAQSVGRNLAIVEDPAESMSPACGMCKDCVFEISTSFLARDSIRYLGAFLWSQEGPPLGLPRTYPSRYRNKTSTLDLSLERSLYHSRGKLEQIYLEPLESVGDNATEVRSILVNIDTSADLIV